MLALWNPSVGSIAAVLGPSKPFLAKTDSAALRIFSTWRRRIVPAAPFAGASALPAAGLPARGLSVAFLRDAGSRVACAVLRVAAISFHPFAQGEGMCIGAVQIPYADRPPLSKHPRAHTESRLDH